jgi:hypothetical protein
MKNTFKLSERNVFFAKIAMAKTTHVDHKKDFPSQFSVFQF